MPYRVEHLGMDASDAHNGRMRIVLCYPAEPHHVQQIAAAAPEAEVVDAGQRHVARELLDADIFCGHAKVPVPWDDVVHRSRLRWIQSSAAGVDHCLTESVIASDIVVTSLSGVLADQVAEHTLALVIGWLRSLPAFLRAQQAKVYRRLPTRDLHHATVGIVGLGGVGRRLAEILKEFKVRIVATDWCPVDKPAYVDELWPPERLDDLLAAADIVTLSAPLNQHTRGMIQAGTLARMRPGALLVNVARGPLVVERDLIAALDAGHLGGAVLDVAEHEPLAETSRLWEFENVIITPHVGGQSARRIDRCTDFFCRNLQSYLQHRPLANVVDKRLGFPLRTGRA